MSEHNDDPDGGLRTYSAVLPPGVRFGPTPVLCPAGPGPWVASGLPPGLRLNPSDGAARAPAASGSEASVPLAGERPPAPEDEVKPDLLIDPPQPKPDPPRPPDRPPP